MAEQITLERDGERPAWQVRVGGTLVGIVWRERREFRVVQEGSSTPASNAFSSREAAARALARMAGRKDFDPEVIEILPKGERGRPPRDQRRR